MNSRTNLKAGRALRKMSVRRESVLSSLVPLLLLIVLSGCVTTGGQTQSPASTPPTLAPPAPQLLSPMPPPGPQPISRASTGSLWQDNTTSLFQDVKAHKIGDIVTITVSEESSASKAATTTASRDKSFSGQFTFSGMGLNPSGSSVNSKNAASFGPYTGTFSNSYKGDGATSKTDSMSAYMTATVTEVLPNGNLVIRGSRWTKVNNEMQQIVLEGVVRPNDITRTNTVLSQQIAEAKIFFVGKGPVSQAQKQGWLGQLFELLNPF